MNHQKVYTKHDIPDSTEAESWPTEDTFIVLGVLYRILPNCKVIPANGNGKEGYNHEST